MVGLFFAVGIVLLLVLVLGVFVPWLRDSKRRVENTRASDETLEYAVPPGQDVAAVVATLRRHGLEGVPVVREGADVVIVRTPSGPEGRERVRIAIAEAPGVNEPGHGGDPAAESGGPSAPEAEPADSAGSAGSRRVRFTDE